jgi:anti-anti-sigma factor
VLASQLSISTERRGWLRLVRAAGDLDIGTAPELCAAIDDHRARRRREWVVLDLSDVGFCDSTGLRALLGAARESRIAGGRLLVVIPRHGQVRRLIEMTGVREFLPVVSSRAAALEALGRSA